MKHLVLLTALLALPAVVRADVLVVNTTGSTYATIQAAVNAAVDGDVVLVKPTAAQPAFTVPDKSLTIVGDSTTSQINVIGVVSVPTLSTGHTVVFANLSVSLPTNTTQVATLRALSLANISGEVRAQHCRFAGCAGTFVNDPFDSGNAIGTPGGAGAWIDASSGGIAFVDCTLQGGDGGGLFGDAAIDPGGNGGDGVRATGSRVVLYDSIVRGGNGGFANFIPGDGGIGMNSLAGAFASVAFGSNSQFIGGSGGHTELSCCTGTPGDGGDGLRIGAGTTAWMLDSVFTGGVAGWWFLNTNVHGQPGQGLNNNGALTTFPVSHASLETPSIVRASTPMSFTLRGDPGDEIFLEQSRKTSFLGTVAWRGFRLAKPVGLNLSLVVPVPLAVIPGSGQITVTVRAPWIEPATNGRTVYYQAMRRSPSGQITLGSFATVTVVAPGF